MFSTLLKEEIILYFTFILSSANAFNLDKVKFLSSGNGLNHYHLLFPNITQFNRDRT